MATKTYELTQSQRNKIKRHAELYGNIEMPSDEWFKANRGRKPWGLFKRDWIVSKMKFTEEYQLGLGQGRVDAANGLEYTEERPDSAYNLGYYRGYQGYESNRRGWNEETRRRFDEKYVEVIV